MYLSGCRTVFLGSRMRVGRLGISAARTALPSALSAGVFACSLPVLDLVLGTQTSIPRSSKFLIFEASITDYLKIRQICSA